MAFKTLNAGCGCNTWGDVRVDIQTFSDLFYLKQTSANIIASLDDLPFRDQVFEETRCHHVLEHVSDPRHCLGELKRVTRGEILIHCPVWHLYSFLIDSITLIKSFMLIPFVKTAYFKDQLYKVRSWSKRYRDHKHYIKGKKINRVYFFFPLEYEIKIKGGIEKNV